MKPQHVSETVVATSPSEPDEFGVVRWRPGVLPALAAELRLEDLQVRDLPDWFKFPVNLTGGTSIQPAFEYLAADVRARGERARETNHARAYDLRSVFEFLALNERSWTEIDQSIFEEFVLDMVCASVACGRDDLGTADELAANDFDDDLELSASTVKRRVDTLKGFCRYAFQGKVPFDATFAAKAGRHAEGSVRPIPPEELRRLVEALGPAPSRRRPGESSRLWCASMLALLAGLRRLEVCGLDVDQIERISLRPDEPLRECALELRITKGGRKRAVLLPTWFVAELKTFIASERRQEVAGSDGPEPIALFVNRACARRNPLGRMTTATLSFDFRAAMKAIDLRRKMPHFRHGTGTSARLHSFHDLRHTCACLFFAAERSRSRNPWVEVQSRLGHRLLRTTTDVYLRFVDQFLGEPSSGQALQSIVRGMVAA